MAHALDGARLKIIRAQEHLKSFNDDAWRYVSTEPYKIVSSIDRDCINVEGVITTEPPASLACIVGGFVTNLRASLDYIAWELVLLAGRSLNDPQLRRVAFPIASTHASFTNPNGASAHLANVCGIPASTISIIESVQPYHAGYESLNSLDLLVRTDKHRTLLLCGLFMESAGSVSIYRGNRLAWTMSGMVRTTTNLAAFGPSFLPATDYSVKVNEQPTVLVALKDIPTPGANTFVGVLEQIIKCVRDIVPRFEGVFV